MPSDQFYTRLPVNDIPLGELLLEEHLFYRVPSDWHVVITDVTGSTKAVTDGLHETVNLVATGSIVAVLNIAFKSGISVPFFFGGDGATFLVPGELLQPVMHALVQHRDNTKKNFGLDLRVGHVSVESIYASGSVLTISKWRTAKLFSIPIVLGEGLSFAERIIKGPEYSITANEFTDQHLDLSGMQCRWDRVSPPMNGDEVVSLLVIARNTASQSIVFQRIITLLDSIYGGQDKRKPISVPQLRFKPTLQKLVIEMRARLGGYRPLYLARVWCTILLAPLYFRTKKGKGYLAELVDMSDTLIIDGKINTVISGNAAQRTKLIAALEDMEKSGEITYGLHVSTESVLSCYVRSLKEGHVHFVDGSGGGYTKAAAMIKGKTTIAIQ